MITEYQTQSELNPALWNGDELKPKLRVSLLKIAKYFYEFLGIETPVNDVTLTGSNANYNWTTKSDIDLHILVNYKLINDNELLVRNHMMAKKNIWNTKYPLKFKGMNIELYAQDTNEPHASSGVYSLCKNKWLMTPNPEMISVEDDAIDKKAKPYEYEIDHLNSEDVDVLDKIKNIKDRLRNLRQTGLGSVGEYSIENLAFKALRNSGHLGKLNNLEKASTFSHLTPKEV